MRKTKQFFWIGCVALGIFLAASSFLMSHAQKTGETQKVENQNADEQARRAGAEVAKSVVGSLFLDAVTVKEIDWKLKEANYLSKKGNDDSTLIIMSFRKDRDTFNIGISEYESAVIASKPFHIPRSHGTSVTFNTYGDEGEKIYLQSGDFVTLNFRLGNFLVGIQGRDEKTSELFASYVVETIKSFSAK